MLSKLYILLFHRPTNCVTHCLFGMNITFAYFKYNTKYVWEFDVGDIADKVGITSVTITMFT